MILKFQNFREATDFMNRAVARRVDLASSLRISRVMPTITTDELDEEQTAWLRQYAKSSCQLFEDVQFEPNASSKEIAP